MSVPPIATFQNIDAAGIGHYLDRLAATERFRKAPGLRHLLEYLIHMAVEGRASEIKESVIAIDVFGRSQNLDNGLGNIVRVQAHRLRKLLDGHYAEDGAGDEVHIVVPKGSYVPQIMRTEMAAHVHTSGAAIPELVWRSPHRWRKALSFVATFTAGAVCVFAALWSTSQISGVAPFGAANPAALRSAPLAVPWSSGLQPGVNCVV